MSALTRGEWKDIRRQVEFVFLDYKTDNPTSTRWEWIFARALREMWRMLGEAEGAIAQREYIDGLGSDGPQASQFSDIRETIEKLPDLPPRSTEAL